MPRPRAARNFNVHYSPASRDRPGNGMRTEPALPVDVCIHHDDRQLASLLSVDQRIEIAVHPPLLRALAPLEPQGLPALLPMLP